MGMISCDQMHKVAPELALGVLPGNERADALAHVEGCTACQVLVDELAQVSDTLLLAAPEIEPSIGFESRVVERVVGAGAHRPRHRWRIGAALLAAAAVVASVIGVGVGALTGGRSPAPATAAAPGGSALRQATFRTAGAGAVGRVVAYAGRPSWVFMTVSKAGGSGWLTCEVTTTSGSSYQLGTFQVYEGRGSWGASVPVPPDQLHSARLVSATGATVATATF